MKKIRDQIEHHILCADRKWKALPAKRQRLFTKLFLAGYAILTVLVLSSICISTRNKTNTMSVSHITTISDHAVVKTRMNNDVESSPIKK